MPPPSPSYKGSRSSGYAKNITGRQKNLQKKRGRKKEGTRCCDDDKKKANDILPVKIIREKRTDRLARVKRGRRKLPHLALTHKSNQSADGREK